MLVDEVLENKFDRRNTKPILLPNQAQYAVQVTTLDDFGILKQNHSL